jgi:hypothetical protein
VQTHVERLLRNKKKLAIALIKNALSFIIPAEANPDGRDKREAFYALENSKLFCVGQSTTFTSCIHIRFQGIFLKTSQQSKVFALASCIS